jgi:hypothetical protein
MKTENMKEYHKNWYANKKKDIDFLDKRANQYSNWYENNKDKKREYCKKYQEQNKDVINEKRRLKSKIRRELDPNFKLRAYLSNAINRQLSKNNNSKNNRSILQFLPYTINQLKEHIEKQFEPWMSWNNRGKYNSKIWDDNNVATWTWQLDHTIPHNKFHYNSMTDQSFIDCWSLSNLRPVSAKLNILKGGK